MPERRLDRQWPLKASRLRHAVEASRAPDMSRHGTLGLKRLQVQDLTHRADDLPTHEESVRKEQHSEFPSHRLATIPGELRAKEHLLRAKEHLLRAKEHLLRAKEQLLRAKEHLLRAKEHLPQAKEHLL